MIVGNVNTKREAVVQLAVLGENQQRQGIKAIIDTGYTGFLTLPSAIITTLELTWYMQQEGILGDGSLCIFNVYEASVIWDGQIRTIEINESEADPLVGMGLLEGYELKIQAVAGGLVTITALPSANLKQRGLTIAVRYRST
jgi:clan AA aspartic protease